MVTKDKKLAAKALSEGLDVYFRQPSTVEFIKVDSDISNYPNGVEYCIGPLEIDLGIK